MEYKPKPGEFFIIDRRTGKKVLVKRKNETVSADRRSTYQRQQDQTRAKQVYRQYEEDKKQEEGMKNLQGFLTFISPSTYIGPVFNNNDKSYVENVMSGEGTGDTAGNVAIDILTPFAVGGARSLATNAVKRFPYRPNTSSLQSIPYDILLKSKEGRGIVAQGILRGELPPTSDMTLTGMQVSPYIRKLMKDQVFNRLSIDPPSDFYDKVYLGSKNLMEPTHASGFYFPESYKVVIKEGIPEEYVLPHELRHKLDYSFPLSNKSKSILNKAYGKEFTSKEVKEHFKPNLDLSKEAVTTNLDSRIKLLESYNPGYNYTNLSLQQQNDIIDKMPDFYIVDAVERSNGYGQTYINYLRQNHLLTKDKIQAFRDAMKYVGGVSIPVTIGTSTQR